MGITSVESLVPPTKRALLRSSSLLVLRCSSVFLLQLCLPAKCVRISLSCIDFLSEALEPSGPVPETQPLFKSHQHILSYRQ